MKNLSNIVDLEKYPINELESLKIKNLVQKCKEDLDQYSCATIPNFILPTAPQERNIYCADPTITYRSAMESECFDKIIF